MTSAADILNRKGGEGTNISEFVGQVITVVEFDLATGAHGEYVVAKALDANGEDIEFQTGAKSVVSKLKDLQKGGFLPIEVKVTSYESRFPGKPGYDIEPA